MNTIKIYNGSDFGREPFATTDIEKVWEGYAEAADFRQYEDADAVQAQAYSDFKKSFVDFQPGNPLHVELAKRAGLM